MTTRKILQIQRLRNEQRMSVVQIAAKMGYCIDTIYKYLKVDCDNPKDPTPSPEKESIAVQYEPIIRQWLTEDKKHFHKQRHTAKRVYDRLRELDKDFRISYKTIQRMYKRIHNELYSSFRDFENLPDTPGEAEIICTEFNCRINNKVCDAHTVSVVFPYSRAVYMQVIPERNTECLLTALQNIYYHIGGVPPYQKFTPKTKLYTYRCGDISDIKEDLFMRFVLYHNFKDDYFAPDNSDTFSLYSSSHISGYFRRTNLADTKNINNLADFNKELLIKCDIFLDRCPTFDKHNSVKFYYETDKMFFLPLPTIPFRVLSWFRRKVDKMSVLSLSQYRRYALPPGMQNRTVYVYLTADKIEIRNLNHDLIQEFDRNYSKDIEEVYNPKDQLQLLRVKPRAVLNCKIKELFPPVLTDYFIRRRESKFIAPYINAMWEICCKSDISTAIACAAEAASKNLPGKNDIIKIYEARAI